MERDDIREMTAGHTDAPGEGAGWTTWELSLDRDDGDDGPGRFAAWERLERILQAQSLDEAPPDFARRTMRRVRFHNATLRWRRRPQPANVMLESAAVVAGVALTLTTAADMLAAGPGRLMLDQVTMFGLGMRVIADALPGPEAPLALSPVNLALSLAVAVAWFGALIVPRTTAQASNRPL